jgi:hypothetical protein
MRRYHKLKGEVTSHPTAGKKTAGKKSNFLK